jgi:type II secretion system protein N
VKKLVKGAIGAAVVLVMVGGVILLAANLYVQSHAAQQQIREALSASLKMPAELTKTTLTPWEGLRIDGITVRPKPSPDNASAPDFLKADSFRVRFAFWPLFRRQLIVREVLLDKPQLSWTQNAEGRWEFPPDENKPAKPQRDPSAADHAMPPQDASSAPETASAPAEVASSTPAPASDSAPAPVAPTRQKEKDKQPPGFHVAVEKFRMRHGVMEFLDKQAKLVGRFEEVNFDGRLIAPRHANGELWFERAWLPFAGLSLTKFRSRYDYDEASGLTLKEGRGELADGTVSVEYHLSTQEPGSPFKLRCRIEGAALDQLTPQTEGVAQFASGRLEGNITAEGLSGDAASRSGSAELRLTDAQFKDIPMLQMLGDAMHIDDLSHPQLKKAELKCHLEGETLYIDSLLLASTDLQLTVQGQYQIESDRLDLQARLTIDRAVSRQLPQIIEANFLPSGDEAPGCRYIDFPVTGTLSKPVTDLRERVLAGSLNSLLQNLRVSKPKTPNPNKKPKRGAGSPSPENTPVPASSTP